MDSTEDAVFSFKKNYRSKIIINVRANLMKGECRVWGRNERNEMEGLKKRFIWEELYMLKVGKVV